MTLPRSLPPLRMPCHELTFLISFKVNTTIRITQAEVLKIVKQLRDRIEDAGVTLRHYRVPSRELRVFLVSSSTEYGTAELSIMCIARIPSARDSPPVFQAGDGPQCQALPSLSPPTRESTFSIGSAPGPTQKAIPSQSRRPCGPTPSRPSTPSLDKIRSSSGKAMVLRTSSSARSLSAASIIVTYSSNLSARYSWSASSATGYFPPPSPSSPLAHGFYVPRRAPARARTLPSAQGGP